LHHEAKLMCLRQNFIKVWDYPANWQKTLGLRTQQTG